MASRSESPLSLRGRYTLVKVIILALAFIAVLVAVAIGRTVVRIRREQRALRDWYDNWYS